MSGESEKPNDLGACIGTIITDKEWIKGEFILFKGLSSCLCCFTQHHPIPVQDWHIMYSIRRDVKWCTKSWKCFHLWTFYPPPSISPSIHSNPWRSFGSGIFILPTKPEVNDKNDITMEETCKVGAQSVSLVSRVFESQWMMRKCGALRCTCILRWIVGGDGLLLWNAHLWVIL